MLCVTLALCAGEDKPSPFDRPVPPSPADPVAHPGVRIWPDPAFNSWPALVYTDERRNAGYQIPLKPGWHNASGSIGWAGQQALPFTLPAETTTDQISGLIDLPQQSGPHQATLTIGDKSFTLGLRLCPADQPWPHVGLREGYPVDVQGLPVVLITQRRDPAEERKWATLRGSFPRPTGKPLVVGDPLEALGAEAWPRATPDAEAKAEWRVATDERHPHHACMVALANLGTDVPRTIVWCPGNQALHAHTWSTEEERLLVAVRTRCEALRARPRLLLVLPADPVDAELHADAATRRELLTQSARSLGWDLLDLSAIAGAPDTACRVAQGVYTRHPTGEAQARCRAAIAAALDQ